jgi:hypothetical protein
MGHAAEQPARCYALFCPWIYSWGVGFGFRIHLMGKGPHFQWKTDTPHGAVSMHCAMLSLCFWAGLLFFRLFAP